MTWTRFMDMHSGGRTKEEPYQYILIEAPENDAKVIFYNRFGHNPERVTCTCCGEDYSIGETESLAEATAYDRSCAYSNEKKAWVEEPDTRWGRKYRTLEQYLTEPDVLVIKAEEIKPAERVGSVPQQGYVWQD